MPFGQLAAFTPPKLIYTFSCFVSSRFKVLRHLPVASEISLCGADVWKRSDLVSDVVRERFAQERKRLMNERAADRARQRRAEQQLARRGAASRAEQEAETMRELEKNRFVGKLLVDAAL